MTIVVISSFLLGSLVGYFMRSIVLALNIPKGW